MANKPTMKSNIDPLFSRQANALRKQCKEEQSKRRKGEQVKWTMPEKEGWDGDLFKWQEMEKMFGSAGGGLGHGEELGQKYLDAVADSEAPGMSGDIVVIVTQTDYLAMMERAFRSRHTMRRPRAWAHTAGVHNGQGDERGPLYQNTVTYIQGILQHMA